MGIYLKPVFKLFVPLLIAHFGMFSMSLVDSVMLGHSSAEHVGLQSIGDTPVTLVLLLLNGLLQGTLFTTAQAFGKNDFPAAGQSLRTALVNGLWLSLMTIPCLIFAPQLISLFDYTPEQTGAAASVTRILSGAIPFSIMFFICMFFSQRHQKNMDNNCICPCRQCAQYFSRLDSDKRPVRFSPAVKCRRRMGNNDCPHVSRLRAVVIHFAPSLF